MFPPDVDTIPQFSVVEVMISSANTGGFDQGYALQVARVRPCEFSLYSMQHPLGLGLLPSTYEDSVRQVCPACVQPTPCGCSDCPVSQAEGHIESNQGLRKVLEDKNTGFFGRITKGAYLIKYNEDYRLVGPKETPSDPQSRHLNVMEGGVYAIDIHKADLLRFTNAGEAEEEDGLTHAQFLVEFAAASGALECYVTYNEYLLRHDPNRSPFTGVPLVDSNSLLQCIRSEDISGVVGQRFSLPFDFSPLERPYLTLEPIEERAGEDSGRPCEDFALASENTAVSGRAYVVALGDVTEEDIMRFLFVPKTGPSGAKGSTGRQDYRLLKKRKAE